MSATIEPENIILHEENTDLMEQIRYKNQVISPLNNSLEKEMKFRGKITTVVREVDTGAMTPETAMSYMRMIVGDKR